MSSGTAWKADTGKNAWRYERRRPERTLLYQLVAEHYPRFVELLTAQDRSLPHYVHEEARGLQAAKSYPQFKLSHYRSGEFLLKDLHPFRFADTINMSQISWVMQLYFMLHILALAAIYFPRQAMVKIVPEDLQAYPFRGFLLDATKAEHEDLRWSLVPSICCNRPSPSIRPLRSNRITAALMELCPEDARPNL